MLFKIIEDGGQRTDCDDTVQRLCGRAQQFFRSAIRHDMLQRNPFEGIKRAVGANPERMYFLLLQRYPLGQ